MIEIIFIYNINISLTQKMDVKSMGKNLSEAIQKNLKPISNINLKPLK